MIYEIVNCSPFFLRLTERLFHVLQQSIQYPPLQKQLKEMGFWWKRNLVRYRWPDRQTCPVCLIPELYARSDGILRRWWIVPYWLHASSAPCRFGLFISLDQILAEMFKIDICTDYYQFVKWIETFFSSGNINPLFSPNDRYDVDIAFLAEVEFLQGFSHAGGVLLYFKIG